LSQGLRRKAIEIPPEIPASLAPIASDLHPHLIKTANHI
jgi:hypothetical protein